MGERVSTPKQNRWWRFNLGAGRSDAKATYEPAQWTGTGPGRSITTYGGQAMTYLQIYRTQPSVRQVVSFIAENIAQVPIKTYQRMSDADRQVLRDHPVQRMLDNPSPMLSQFEFIRDLVTDLEVFDVAFFQIARANGGKDLAVTRLFPDSVELRDISSLLGPQTFRVHRGDGTYVDLSREDVLYLKGYGDERGISPMETLRQTIAEDQAASKYREGLYKNGMRNAGVIERPLEAPDWSEKARLRFLGQLEDRFTGEQNSGRPLLLEEGMTWKSDQISMQSQEYIAGRELTTRVVANAYRISPSILGLADAPYASITAYNQQLYQNALAPRLTHITQSIERQLLALTERRDDNIYLEFNLQAKLRGSFQEQAAIAQMAVGKPFMTVDEYRALLDLPPMEQGEAGPRFADVGLPALVQAGIVSAAWAAEQVGAPTEGLPTIAEPMGGSPDPSPAGGTPGAPQTGAGATDQPAPSQDQPKQAKASRGDRGLTNRRSTYADQIAQELNKTFARVLRSAKAKSYVKARYERELAADLRPVLERVTVAEGARKAAQLGGEFDPAYVQHYLDSAAKNIARNVAASAEEAVKRHTGEDGAVNEDALKTALNGIAVATGIGAATNLVSFARESAGKQTNAGTKTWTVTSGADSRHSDVDGETVKLGTLFSNGLAYPGDPSGDPEQTAGCLCLLDIN